MACAGAADHGRVYRLAATGGARAGRDVRVGYLNAAQVNLAFADADHARALAAMDCRYADGQAIVWAARRLGPGVPERINAGDFTRRFFERAAADGLRVALVGGHPGEAERAAELFRSWAPTLNLVYIHDGFMNDAQAAAIGAAIEAADPDLTIVAMGAPRQERRTLEWSRAAGHARGGASARCSNTLGHAGARAGLDAAGGAGMALPVRPGTGPLWRRYLIGNPLFVWRVVRGKPVTGAAEK